VRTTSLQRYCENAVLALSAFTILWKGGKSLESTWLLAGVAGACTLLQYMRRGQKIEIRDQQIELVTFLLILWMFLSYIFSTTLNYGLDEVLRDTSLGLLLLWVLRREDPVSGGKKESFQERFFSILFSATIASCIIGIFIYIFQPVNRFVGTFFDWRFHTDYWPNAAAEFLLLAWPIVLLQSQHRRFVLPRTPLLRAVAAKVFPLIPTGLVLGCLLLTFSRGGIISFIGQVVLLTLLLFFRKGTEHRLRMHLLKIGASLAIGLLIFTGVNALRAPFHPVESVERKVTFTAAEGSSSVSERASFWKQAMDMTLERPLFGWGPGSFRFVQPHLQESVLATSDHPHNIFLKFSAERGVVGALLSLSLLFLIFTGGMHLTLRGKRLSANFDHTRFGSPLLFTALAGVVAHNLIDFNLQFVGIALPFTLCLGFLARGEEGKHVPVVKKKYRVLFRLLPPVIASLLLLFSFREGVYLVTSSMGRHAEAAGDGAAALDWYETSEGEWFTRDMELSRAMLFLDAGNLENAETVLRTSLRRNAQDGRTWKLLGTLLASSESFPEAIEAYKIAFAYNGWNDLGISNGLLQALLAETYLQETSDAAADSTHLTPHPDLQTFVPLIESRVRDFARAIEQNLHFAALSANPEEAVDILITLSVLSPEKAPEYRAMIEEIERETNEERERWSARKPGWIW